MQESHQDKTKQKQKHPKPINQQQQKKPNPTFLRMRCFGREQGGSGDGLTLLWDQKCT